MTRIAMPSEYPILRVDSAVGFRLTPGLQEMMDEFPFAKQDFDALKCQISSDRRLLWVAKNPEKDAVGYILCDPAVKHSKVMPGSGFYIVQRFVDPCCRRMKICSRLVGIVSRYAREEMNKRSIFEEVSIDNHSGINSSIALGFVEFAQETRGKDIYSIRKKIVRRITSS